MISVIIPTLNEASVIEKTLEQFRSCRTRHVEVIVSDGGSADGTPALAEKYADVVVVHKGGKRQTIAGGRNAGAREAHGDLLAFFDADITIADPDSFFEKAEEVFRTRPDVVALTGNLRVLLPQETRSDWFFFSLINYAYLFLNNVLRMGAASGEFQMMRRDVFQKLGGYREDLAVAEDQEFFRRLARAGKTHFDRRLTVYHTGRRIHKVGWPKILSLWILNGIFVPLFGRSFNSVWKEIR